MNRDDQDPFGFGQVRPEPSGPWAKAPEDILFEDGPAQAFDSGGFGMPMRPHGEVDFGQHLASFDSDILGEGGGPAIASATVAGAFGRREAAVQETGSQPPRSPLTNAPRAAPVAPARPRAPMPVPVPAARPTPLPRRGGLLGLVLPVVVLAAGLAGGAWLHLALDNQVLAGVGCALGLVGAAFSWILLRG